MLDFGSMLVRNSFEVEDDIFSFCKLDSIQDSSDFVIKNNHWDGQLKFEDFSSENNFFNESTLVSPTDFNISTDFWDYFLNDNKDNCSQIHLGSSYNVGYTYESNYHNSTTIESSESIPLNLLNNNNISNIEIIKGQSIKKRIKNNKISRRNYGRVSKQRPKGSKKIVQFKRDFNYEGVNIPTKVYDCTELQNIAKNEPPNSFEEMHKRKLIKLLNNKHVNITEIRRKRHIRENLNSYLGYQHNDIVYEENKNFDITKPYEPQYIRYIVDLESTPPLPFNQTRSGLCPYCPDLHFYEIKTSAYAQHLALQHGVFTDNFLTPNPLLYGLYKLVKPESPNKKRPKKTKAHELDREGVICPCCYEVIGVNCSKKTANLKPLTNYLRHFRDDHFYCKEKKDPYTFFDKLELKN